MKKSVFNRWIYFIYSSFGSTGALLLNHFFDSAWFTLFAVLGPGIFFSLAVILIRRLSHRANPVGYGFLITLLLAIFGTLIMALYIDSDSGDEIIIIPILAGIGALISVFTGAGYGKFLDREHPPILYVILLSSGSLVISFLGLKIIERFSAVDLGIYGFLILMVIWQLAMGYLFSQETSEDLPDSKENLLHRIEDIGKK